MMFNNNNHKYRFILYQTYFTQREKISITRAQAAFNKENSVSLLACIDHTIGITPLLKNRN